MTELRMSRWMGPLGLAIFILLFVGFGPLSGSPPGENASGLSVVSYYNAHQTIGWAQLYVIGPGLALLVLFVSHLRDVLRSSQASGPLPNVVYAAGVILVAALIATGGTVHIALLLASHSHQAAIAQTLNFLSSNSELSLLYGFALLTLATGAAILTGSTLPKWLGWVAILIGVVCVLGPIGFFGVLAAAIWIPVLGFVIGAKGKTSVETPREGTSAGLPTG